MDSQTSTPTHQNPKESASESSKRQENFRNSGKKANLEIPRLKIAKQGDSQNNRYLKEANDGEDKLLLRKVPSLPDVEGIPKKDDSAFTNDWVISNPKKSIENAPVSISFSKSRDDPQFIDTESKKDSLTPNESQSNFLLFVLKY